MSTLNAGARPRHFCSSTSDSSGSNISYVSLLDEAQGEQGFDSGFQQVPDFDPKAVRDEAGVRAGQDYVFVPKGKNLLLVRVPTRDEMFGLFKGADNSDVRDRADRY